MGEVIGASWWHSLGGISFLENDDRTFGCIAVANKCNNCQTTQSFSLSYKSSIRDQTSGHPQRGGEEFRCPWSHDVGVGGNDRVDYTLRGV